ncbi:MAG TPA: hypothetical protein VFN31_01290 [Candidatus Saccharimonadales bacterium]|nr:hypothetical protein [Candidatus Saccharimonadales bacterium]
MSKPLYIIYIPGLGDVPDPRSQIAIVRSWKRYGVIPETFLMKWTVTEPYETKFNRLLKHIDDLYEAGYAIGLVGASAGASVVVNAFSARQDKVIGIVLIAGKVNRPGSIGAGLRRNNAALPASVAQTATSLAGLDANKKRLILSRYAFIDNYVRRSDSHIPGAKNVIVPSIGHIFTIATQLLFGAPSFLKFLKSLN